MPVDRKQVRRWASSTSDTPITKSVVRALLAELERAERDLNDVTEEADVFANKLAAADARAEQAERERDNMKALLVSAGYTVNDWDPA